MQMVAYPSVLLIAFLGASLQFTRPGLARGLGGVAVAGLVVVSLGGISKLHQAEGPISAWVSSTRSATADALDQVAIGLPQRGTVTYAHLGQNDEEAVVEFQSEGLDLACPDLSQYTFSPDLSDILNCIVTTRPHLVLVTSSFEMLASAPRRWNEFVARGSSLLHRLYERILTLDAKRGPIEAGRSADRGNGVGIHLLETRLSELRPVLVDEELCGKLRGFFHTESGMGGVIRISLR